MKIIESNLSFGSMSRRSRTTRIILHHAEASTCTVQDVHRWHKNNGWAGIGYHFFVRKDGSVYRGRPEGTVGAHASGSNSDSIGICFEGTYMTETMPTAQKAAGKELVAYLKNKYGIGIVQRHCDVCATSCPGTNFPFTEIAEASGSMTVTPAPSKPAASGNAWVRGLQTECNAQGFSHQTVDGLPGPNTLTGCPTLYAGSSGNITRLMQERLIALGYSCGSCGADGKNGAGTQAAIKAFQRAHNLVADGIVGPKTWSKLLGLS